MENKLNPSILTRRKFLQKSGGLTLGITALAAFPGMLATPREGLSTNGSQLTAWVNIQPDGKITIMNPAAEMGQGSMTALPVIIAEELDADWSQVVIEHSPNDVDTYGLERWGGRKIMLTVGSFTVSGYYESLRKAGAQARYVLLYSAAKKWGVPLEELKTNPSRILHPKTSQEISYGEIISDISMPESLPDLPLKDPENFQLIGSVMPRWDIPQKVDGSAIFAGDVRVPNMLYGVIERGKVHGAKPNLQNLSEIQEMEGIEEVVEMDYGVGIIASTIERALKAKKLLNIAWTNDTPSQGHGSQESFERYADLAGDATEKGKVLTEIGNVEHAKSEAHTTYEADYKNDYVYHAQMEPLNAMASVSPDGQSVEVWAGTQAAGSLSSTVAQVLGIEASQVKFHPQYLGGGLGRRSLHDYVIEAVKLSNAVKKPVKLIWTRQDDLQYGHYRPLSLQRMKASVGKNGGLLGLSHTIVGDGSNLLASGAKNAYYDIPNQHLEIRTVNNGIRLKHWRAVGHGPNKFAIESFIDELASDQGMDPLAYRQQLMHNHPRALATLNKASEMARWSEPAQEGRAKGVAFGERSGALVTGICEISLDPEKGKIRVHHFWMAVDAGTIVQPDNAIAQLEGGIIMGMSSVLQEQLTIVNGEVQQTNLHDYSLLRISDVPESMDIFLMPSMEAPEGIGEGSLPVVGGAIGNAFAALTGKRLRHLPFTPDRVKAALR
ncbi:MAG: molybdopterin cofactor-binding domain-containing protein [Bacteroidota bacterium]